MQNSFDLEEVLYSPQAQNLEKNLFARKTAQQFSDKAEELSSDEAQRDAEQQKLVADAVDAIRRLHVNHTGVETKRQELRNRRGLHLAKGQDSPSLDKEISALDINEARIDDETRAREVELKSLRQEAATVHLAFVQKRRDVFALIAETLASEAARAKTEWEVRLDVSVLATRRLMEYDSGLYTARGRAATGVPTESIPA